MIRVANNQKRNLYRTCSIIKIKIEVIEVKKNFFVQNLGIYIMVLGQFYITIFKIQTRILNDGCHCAKICSCNRKNIVEFFTIQPTHERQWD